MVEVVVEVLEGRYVSGENRQVAEDCVDDNVVAKTLDKEAGE